VLDSAINYAHPAARDFFDQIVMKLSSAARFVIEEMRIKQTDGTKTAGRSRSEFRAAPRAVAG